MKREKCTVLSSWINPWSEKLLALKRPLLEKIASEEFEISDLNTQDVLVFLNLADLLDFIPWVDEQQFDGEALLCLTDQDLESQKFSLSKRLSFFTTLQYLQDGVFLNKAHSRECPVCKFQPEHLFWKEWNLSLPQDLGLTPPMLIGFKYEAHIRFIINASIEKRNQIRKTLIDIKRAHDDYVAELRKK